MDLPDEQRLKETIEHLTRENAKLRTQLAVTQQWNPPLDLERAFRSARGWQLLTVPLTPEKPTLVLISGTRHGGENQDVEAAGEVWRHLQTAAPPGNGIGPFARARMPSQLLGYLREHGGQTIIVLNRDLRRGQVSRAARMLRDSAKKRRPATRLLELSAIPLLSLCALLHGNVPKGAVGFTAAAAPAVVILPAHAMSTASPYIDSYTVSVRTRTASQMRSDNKEPSRPAGSISPQGASRPH